MPFSVTWAICLDSELAARPNDWVIARVCASRQEAESALSVPVRALLSLPREVFDEKVLVRRAYRVKFDGEKEQGTAFEFRRI